VSYREPTLGLSRNGLAGALWDAYCRKFSADLIEYGPAGSLSLLRPNNIILLIRNYNPAQTYQDAERVDMKWWTSCTFLLVTVGLHWIAGKLGLSAFSECSF